MTSRSLVLAFAAALATAVVGCSHNNDNHNAATPMHSNMAMVDDCPKCPGVQHATADGKCPVCGMQVK